MSIPTPAQKTVLDTLKDHWRTEGVAPSVAELARALGRTPPTVHKHLKKLVAHGLVEHEPGLGRSWRPVEASNSERGGGTGSRNRRSRLWATGTELERWAATREAQERLPELLRRLIAASCPRDQYHLRASEGVQLGGWDGKVESKTRAAFVPLGASVWEMGTTKPPSRKAREDYNKRTDEPGEVNPAQTHYRFVTLHRWSGKESWAESRSRTGPWMSVRVLDADDLEAWLDTAPAVRLWLSRLLGVAPVGADDLEGWWERFSHRTNPPILPTLAIGGRTAAKQQLLTSLAESPGFVRVSADSQIEAQAFVAAAIADPRVSEEFESLLSRTVIVRDLEAWRKLEVRSEPLILISEGLDSADLAAATRNGHWVIVPEARVAGAPNRAIDLPLPTVEDLRESLRDMGLAEDDVRRTVKRSRRRLSVMLRDLGPNDRPPWLNEDLPAELMAAFLVGSWGAEHEPDMKVMAKLAGQSYEDVEKVLSPFADRPGGPLTRTGGVWTWTSRAEAADWLVGHISRRLLDRFATLAVEVLSEIDPRFELPEEERWAAALHGKALARSPQLRKGVAESLAILGVSQHPTTDGRAAVAVRTLLDGVRDWRLWASLSELLRPLAEAAPDEFLDAVELLAHEESVAVPLMSDAGGPLGGSCHHSGLLWALELLAWSPDYFARCITVLAGLARFDPGGRWTNRPSATLRSVFLPWLPQTLVPPQQRLDAIDLLYVHQPEVAWSLVLSLLPTPGGDTSSYGAKPEWRDWHLPAPDPVMLPDYWEHVRALLTRLLSWASDSPDRWASLLEICNGPYMFERVLDVFEPIVPSLANKDDLAAVRRILRHILHRHRTYADADWALDTEFLDRVQALYDALEPEEATAKLAWLFDRVPELPEGGQRDFTLEQEALAATRDAAAGVLLADVGIDGIKTLAAAVEAPEQLGWSVGVQITADADVVTLYEFAADAASTWTNPFNRGLIQGRRRVSGDTWVREFLSARQEAGWDPRASGHFAANLQFGPAAWDLVDDQAPEAQETYWKTTRVQVVRPQAAAPRALRGLLEANRPHAALYVASFAVHRQEDHPPVPGDLIIQVLHRAATSSLTDEDPPPPTVAWSYDVPRLVNAAEAARIDQTVLAQMEWLWLPAFGAPGNRPSRLEGALASDPSFFVQLLTFVFRGRNETPSESPTEEQRSRGQAAYRLLRSWRRLPGIDDKGRLDAQGLSEWVAAARKLCKDADRAEIGDIQIGQMLASSPIGEDGLWPHEGVRAVIENARSRPLERGVHTGLQNGRGVVTKAIGEGGRQEFELETQYHEGAKQLATRWPRTARVLRDVARSYGESGRREDVRAQLDEDAFL